MKGVKKYIIKSLKTEFFDYSFCLSPWVRKKEYIMCGKSVKISKNKVYENIHNEEFLNNLILKIYRDIKNEN